ncbi:MAG: 50S ribosomal protein L4 [Candidatus Jorgensenbacteria bacterium]
MTTNLYNQKNEKVGTVELPNSVFGAKWNATLVQQVATSQLANRRNPTAHAKDRSEVRGGGRKPWKQKHTGRARHGSSRSPLWIGGGTTHGPRNERSFAKKIPINMRRAALRSVLSKKLAEDEVRVVDTFTIPEPKTKHVAALVKSFFGKPASILFVPGKGAVGFSRAGRNLPKTQIMRAPSLNVYDCLSHRYLMLEKDAIAELRGAK